jgi:hypothetical protein
MSCGCTHYKENKGMTYFQFRGRSISDLWRGRKQPARPAPESDLCMQNLLDLAALDDGQLSHDGVRRLAAHVASCPSCACLLESLHHDPMHAEGSGRYPAAESQHPIFEPMSPSPPSRQDGDGDGY